METLGRNTTPLYRFSGSFLLKFSSFSLREGNPFFYFLSRLVNYLTFSVPLWVSKIPPPRFLKRSYLDRRYDFARRLELSSFENILPYSIYKRYGDKYILSLKRNKYLYYYRKRRICDAVSLRAFYKILLILFVFQR